MSIAKIDANELQSDALITSKPEPIVATYWKRLQRHKLATASLILLSLITIFVVLGPIIMAQQTYFNVSKGEYVHYSRDTQDLASRNSAPSIEHPLGTDELGRDVLYRLMVAGRLSLVIAFSVTLIAETFGMFVGAISGYYGRWIDSTIQRIVEFIIILPSLALLLVLSSVLRDLRFSFLPPEWSQAVVIIAILVLLGWTGACRLTRAEVLKLRQQEFTEAAKALGMGDLQIITRHMMPNAIPPIIVSATLSLGGVILAESVLSFLGFGIQQPVATWGNMLQDVQKDMFTAPWKALYPGLLIFITVLAFNYLGDGLRDALDPRLKL